MRIDPLTDKLLSLSEAAELLPRRRGGAKVSLSTLWRWHNHGSRGVRLEVVRVGGHVYTTKAALEDFIIQRSRQTSEESPPTSPVHRSEQAMKVLERMGL